jgi:hypothetical protein
VSSFRYMEILTIVLGALITVSVVMICLPAISIYVVAYRSIELVKTLFEIFKLTTEMRYELWCFDGVKIRRTKKMEMMKVDEQLPLALMPEDKAGNASKVDGVSTWSCDASMGTIVAAEDGLSATFTPVGPLGTTKVQALADADLGEGVKSILAEVEIQILAGETVRMNIKAGPAVKPA